MSIVDLVIARKQKERKEQEALSLRPKTLLEPDRTTFYCDVQAKSFRIMGVKILEHYPSGDCRVLSPNGVQFTARAEEVFHIRKGDWHEQPEI